MVVEAVNQVRVKKNPTSLPLVRFESINEGKVAQIMHIGPFSEEGPTVQKLHSFIKDSGKKIIGKHHEVYLSDIRRAAPEKWKTIIYLFQRSQTINGKDDRTRWKNDISSTIII